MKLRMTKEYIAAAVLTLAGTVLALMLVFNPELPGPSQLTDALYRPLINLLEQWQAERSDWTG